ncbi:hypothetical protein [Corynebacterium guangdongense]|uniref:Uncharacterized protein n=1 Tax=Corynebacterium guangdongense TaxID=1783348 RepID=A0ABU2A0F9_9CORY|nr:hypothetical protein [Corynebacterium guangdongense]MDR7330641.1 hypothetical protein [Corynebacterium guangdongense]WJZ16657.1 hypothetical protein CGUA_00240 [Corynebacterium guangdongense]
MSNTPTNPDKNPFEDQNLTPGQEEDQLEPDADTKPGTDGVLDEDELVDEQGEESFPASDPPAFY